MRNGENMMISESTSPQKIIAEQQHRPYPLPDLPWASTQRWEDVLFLHWPVSPEALALYIPQQLQLDLYEGAAWLGIVFFQVKGMRPHFMPALPWISSYLQLNVRTYVTYNGCPGVYFLSLDVNSTLACILAKTAYSLPFRKTNMRMDKQDDSIHIVSKWKKESLAEELSCSYTPVSSVFHPKINSLDDWLLERYCLWNLRQGKVFRTDIHHTKWNLQKADATIHSNSIAHVLPRAAFQDHPMIHYSALKQALFWLPVNEEHEGSFSR